MEFNEQETMQLTSAQNLLNAFVTVLQDCSHSFSAKLFFYLFDLNE